MDPSGQERDPVDTSVLPVDAGQRGPSPAPRGGVKSPQLFHTLVLPDEVERWSLTTLREKVVKIGAKVIRHARYTVFQMGEVAVHRELFRRILGLIDDLRLRQVALC